MSVRSVALIGAGAIGAYVIWGLGRVNDVGFCVVAEGERKERLERDGIEINGNHYDLCVKTPEEAKGADLVIVAVKYGGLKEAVSAVGKICGDNTVVMSLMNGIDSEEKIAAAVGEDHVVYSLMRIASRRVGNSVIFDPDSTLGIFYGEKDGNNETKRIRDLTELFEKAGLNHHLLDDIVLDQWVKYMENIAYNIPQAILGVGYGSFFDSDNVAFLRDALERDVRKVAEASGIALPPLSGFRKGYKKAARYSTLQDLDAGRHTEIDMFLGVLIEKAKAHGIEVPSAEYAYHTIKALEEKNDGLFDYTEQQLVGEEN